MSVLDWKSYVVALPENAQIPMDKYIENPSRSARIPIPMDIFPTDFQTKTFAGKSTRNYRPT